MAEVLSGCASVRQTSISNFTLHIPLLWEVSGGCVVLMQYKSICLMQSVIFGNSLLLYS